MKANFSRKIFITRFSAYGVLNIGRERIDIKEYLQNNRNNTNVNRYLQNIDVLNSRDEITSKGQKLMDTGTLFQEEEGKYAFWVTENDPFLNSKIIYLRRDRYSNEDKNIQNRKNSNFRGEHNVIIKDKDGKQEVKTIELREMMSYSSEIQNSELSLVWNFEIKTNQTFPFSTNYFLEGNLIDTVSVERGNRKETSKDEIKELNKYKFNYHLFLDEFRNIFIKNGMDWDEKLSRMRIEFSKEVHSEKEWENFEIGNLELKQKDFGKGLFLKASLHQVPIMPKSEESANEWRNYLLNQILKRNYITEEQFNENLSNLNKKEAFRIYNLQSPKNIEYIQVLKPQRAEEPEAYYHLASQIDLNPFQKISKPILQFSIKSGEQKSIREIFLTLISPNKVVKKIIVSDRYAGSNIYHLLSILEVYFSTSLQTVILFTISEKIPKEVNVPNFLNVISMKKGDTMNDTHDRVIVLEYTDGNRDIWKLTRGIDILELPTNSQINSDQKSSTRSCTFIKVSEGDIEDYIRSVFS
jgi:hypothetical protein